ncbi:hypothetical protein PoB_007611300 [Plakobranchus ocellatus]|uniref:Uncharacterized protein n=1 Tax=Plakobranchus ocellatus TaxID=259542 RepID=A0AAV4DZB4_9GAST|nr:hypothetical protein PoB_007611300 [Plakobranchus ocellatus]
MLCRGLSLVCYGDQKTVAVRRRHPPAAAGDNSHLTMTEKLLATASRTAPSLAQGVSGTVDSEFALKFAGTLLSRVRAPPPSPWPDGGPESLRDHLVVDWLYIQKTKPSLTHLLMTE